MQSRAGVTAESLVELKEALKLVMNESAAGEPYAAEEVQVSDRPRGQQSLVLGDNKPGSFWPRSARSGFHRNIVSRRQHHCGVSFGLCTCVLVHGHVFTNLLSRLVSSTQQLHAETCKSVLRMWVWGSPCRLTWSLRPGRKSLDRDMQRRIFYLRLTRR